MTAGSLIIRPETSADIVAIDHVVKAAFGRDDEMLLARRLRNEDYQDVSLVAEQDAQIVGHILFSSIMVDLGGIHTNVLSLAPLSVVSAQQRKGIGSRLVVDGLGACQKSNSIGVFVLGEPAYYRRFGFSSALAAKFDSPFSMEAFMAIGFRWEFEALEGGTVIYSPPFELSSNS